MESTDDALTGTGVYLDCTLHFYGQKPFWRSDMGGAVFLNCDFYVCHEEDRQYFCKSVGPLSIVDCVIIRRSRFMRAGHMIPQIGCVVTNTM